MKPLASYSLEELKTAYSIKTFANRRFLEEWLASLGHELREKEGYPEYVAYQAGNYYQRGLGETEREAVLDFLNKYLNINDTTLPSSPEVPNLPPRVYGD